MSMTMAMNFDEILSAAEYDFLRDDERLGDNVILLGLGGSLAYGTNNENSDIDIRGCAVNSRREILLGRDFEQVSETATDTVVYSFKKLVQLLANCNPNTIELLGLNPDQYIKVTSIGRELLDNTGLFLSQRAVKSFGGYADQQLHMLLNGSADNLGIRNRRAIQHNKLGKHSMHLVRLMYMCFDILEKGVVKTCREAEHDLLMDIRNGKYLADGDKPTPEFFELVEGLRKRFEYAAANTSLPPEPDMKKIEDFVISVNARVVCGEVAL